MTVRHSIARLFTVVLASFAGQAAWAADAPLHCARGAEADRPRSQQVTLAGVPAITRAPASITQPPIILWHGFGPPASEKALADALPLDDVPALKVYLGLPLFGARAPASAADSLMKRQAKDYGLRVFEPVVLGAANELSAVIAALRKARCMGSSERIGLFGFSAGGAAVLLALEEHDVPIGAAVTLNAPAGLTPSIEAMERATHHPYSWSPASRQLAERYDPVRRAQDIATGNPPPALLLIHGADDPVVTSKGAEALHAALVPLYERAHSTDRLRLVIAPDVSHAWTDPQTLHTLRTSIAQWFSQHLAS